ncbi:MAG TPA: tRNA pseudouridine(55) synthase TruB [Thermoanaerobacterales bacterium]|mgnify:CR=1 FL=1|nr:tRNA pseudouridine(55) synthase TruB [Thermoanaerobacterales bacterium]
MKGVINVLKPPGMTSHDVVNFLRRLFQIKKIGHSGTLDPAAAGVLPVFIGKAAKAIEFFMDDDKEYIAEMRFGVTTDTGDLDGNVTNISKVNITKSHLEEILKQFTGEISQVPPMYSAVRYKGKKLYELARKGIVVERKPRNVKIYSLDLIDYSHDTAIVKVACSKGTYIRTLCEDIGNMLGCGACLSCLVRTSSGPFKIENSFTLEEIQDAVLNGKLDDVLLPVDRFLEKMPKVNLAVDKEGFFSKGKMINGDFQFLNDIDTLVRVYNNKEFLGIAKVVKDKDSILLQVLKSLK